MADDQTNNQARDRFRRFKVARRVQAPPPAEDDALRGTPEQVRALNQGCSGCWKVTLLILVIMMASIVGTCAFVDLPVNPFGP